MAGRKASGHIGDGRQGERGWGRRFISTEERRAKQESLADGAPLCEVVVRVAARVGSEGLKIRS